MSTLSASRFAVLFGCRVSALLRPLSAVALAFAMIATFAQASRAAIIYDVNINTTGLSGVFGNLAFDLINGDGANNNSVSITQLTTDGTGLVTTDFSISDVLFFNEVQRSLTFGTFLSFSFSATTNFAGGTPDSFSFFLLNSSGTLSLVTTSDPTGADSLFGLDLDGTAAGLLTTSFATEPQGVSVTVAPAAPIPEPASLATWSLMAAGIGVFARRRRAKQELRSRSY